MSLNHFTFATYITARLAFDTKFDDNHWLFHLKKRNMINYPLIIPNQFHHRKEVFQLKWNFICDSQNKKTCVSLPNLSILLRWRLIIANNKEYALTFSLRKRDERNKKSKKRIPLKPIQTIHLKPHVTQLNDTECQNLCWIEFNLASLCSQRVYTFSPSCLSLSYGHENYSPTSI